MHNSFIGIMVNESPDLLVGLLGILKSGNCFVPISPMYPNDRIEFIINDCHIKVLVTDAPNYDRARHIARENRLLEQVLCIDHFSGEENPLPQEPDEVSKDQLCYSIYTSGSTGKPKGVPITHANLTPLLLWFRDYFHLGENIKILQTLPYTFDFGVFEILSTLLFGGTIYYLDEKKLSDFSEYVDLVNQYEINIIHTTPSFFASIAALGYKMPTVKQLHFGGEKLTFQLIEKVSPLLAKEHKIYNGYGPTETTVNSSIFSITPEDRPYIKKLDSIPIGRPSAGNFIYILDRHKCLLPAGIAGEICIGGQGTAQGYLNRPELTAERFRITVISHSSFVIGSFSNFSPNDQCPMTNDRSSGFLPIYLTGDLGRWLQDGNIQYMGRMDDQVKIRGFRIELGEIENYLLNHHLVKETTVMVKEDNQGDRSLCAYIVPAEGIDHESLLEELREYLFSQLPGYMVPSFFVPLEQMPLSPSGKVDRNALPVPVVVDAVQYVAPQTPIQKRMQKIWQQVLELDKIGIYDNFFVIGGHSLKGIQMINEIHKEFDIKIPLIEFFAAPTIEELSGYIEKSSADQHTSIPVAEKKDHYVLSPAQKRLYILQQMELDGISYNMPVTLPLNIEIDKEHLVQTFKKMIQRHEGLRTSFKMINKEPIQVVHPPHEVIFEMGYDETDEKGAKEQINHFVKPFDLGQAPLMRVRLIKLPHTPTALRPHPYQEGKENKYLLLVDTHHIIIDGVSQEIFTREFMALYMGEELSSLYLQYKDYVEWQNSEKEKESKKKQEKYWLQEFAGEAPVLNLPLDYQRPPVQSFAGNHLDFTLSQKDTEALKSLAVETDSTLYMLLLAIFNVLLAKLCANEDIVVGTVTAGRQHADLHQVMGMFVNTLALRNYPQGQKTFKEFLQEVKQKTLHAFENQDYPFENLVENTDTQRDVSRNPLFDVVFTLTTLEGEVGEIAQSISPESRESYKVDFLIAKFDLMLDAYEEAENLTFSFTYCTKLFKPGTIRRFIDYFKMIIPGILKNSEIKISEIAFMSEEEKNRILSGFNHPGIEYPKNKTIHQLFEEQVERIPDHTAVVGEMHSAKRKAQSIERNNQRHAPCAMRCALTYRELNEKSDQLAFQLIGKGVKPDTIVGTMVERFVEMVIAMVGILKAGGAYLPIDPDYPEERIDYMLKDSNAMVLVTTSDLSEKFEKLSIVNCQLLMVNEKPSDHRRLNKPPKESSFHLHLSPVPATSLSYIIYTSGTTGKPKGVLVEHRNVVSLMFHDNYLFDFNQEDVWTMFHSYCFDFSVWEMYGALLYGGKLLLIPKITARDPQHYLDILKKEQVTILNQTPAVFYNISNQEMESPGKQLNLRYVIFAGEALTPAKLKDWQEKYPQTKLVNMYGITETTVHVTYKELETRDLELNISNIGQPIPTLSTYVMDKNLKLVPIGTNGELFVSGEGLGRGYLNRPELTADKFVNNPYIPGERLYQSGDQGRLLGNGQLEYLGRIDHQVKIRGFRIELGEIEKQLLKLDIVRDAVVIKDNNENRLVSYLIPEEKYKYTIFQLLKLQKEGLARDKKRCDLDNGMPIFYLNRFETDFMYREIFEDLSYLKNGIVLEDGDCIFDVGANIGLFSLFAGGICKNAKIYSFEPIPPVYELLKLNAAIYDSEIKTFNFGLSETENEAVFTFYPHASVLSGQYADFEEEKKTVRAFIHQQHTGQEDNQSLSQIPINELLEERLDHVRFKCHLKTLSKVIKEENIEKIDLLKIDVEKSELDVLKGISEEDWPKIKQIVIEVHDADNRLNKITQILKHRGFVVSVETDDLLENTSLFNLYAISKTFKPQSTDNTNIPENNFLYSPGKYINIVRHSLQETLPDYMIPSTFIPIEKIPLTVNGKLDRKALPQIFFLKDQSHTYHAPRNRIEKKLADIWSDVLFPGGGDSLPGAPRETLIGIDDNFFQLGGHSLTATGMAAKIHRELDIRIPLVEVFQNLTIRQLAEYIRGAQKQPSISVVKNEEENLVLMKTKTDRPNHIFFTHDGSGEIEGYIEFCQHLEAAFNCWGIRADRIKSYHPQNLTIEKVAEKYIEKIKKIQPQGPYFIAGWSLGGTIAFEMTRQLEQMGEKVAFLGLIDSPGPRVYSNKDTPQFTLESEKNFIQGYLPASEIEKELEGVTNINDIWPLLVQYLESSNHIDGESIKKLIMEFEAHFIPAYHQQDIGQLIKYLNIGRTLHHSRALYSPPGKINAVVHYFAASQSPRTIRDGWDEYCLIPINDYQIPGDHYSIFKMPAVVEFAKQFDRQLHKLRE